MTTNVTRSCDRPGGALACPEPSSLTFAALPPAVQHITGFAASAAARRSRHSWGRLEFLIREHFERRNPDEALDDLKRRASFSKKDGALLRD